MPRFASASWDCTHMLEMIEDLSAIGSGTD